MRAVRSTVKVRFDARQSFSIPNPAGRIALRLHQSCLALIGFWRIFNWLNVCAIFESIDYVMAERIRSVLKNALAVQLAVLR